MTAPDFIHHPQIGIGALSPGQRAHLLLRFRADAVSLWPVSAMLCDRTDDDPGVQPVSALPLVQVFGARVA